jgi:hypothetical protein
LSRRVAEGALRNPALFSVARARLAAAAAVAAAGDDDAPAAPSPPPRAPADDGERRIALREEGAEPPSPPSPPSRPPPMPPSSSPPRLSVRPVSHGDLCREAYADSPKSPLEVVLNPVTPRLLPLYA